MAELKTLKDLDSKAYYEEGTIWGSLMIHRGDLKRELGINWIKDMEKKEIEDFRDGYKAHISHSSFYQQWDIDKLSDKEILKIQKDYMDEVYGRFKIIAWIKQVFNITEEDLE